MECKGKAISIQFSQLVKPASCILIIDNEARYYKKDDELDKDDCKKD